MKEKFNRIPAFITAASFALISAGASLPATASEKGFTERNVTGALKKIKEDEKPIIMPLRFVTVAKDVNGESRFLSENGRYEIKGQIVDTWTGMEVNNYEDAKFSKNHIPLDKVRFNSVNMQSIVYGDNEDQPVMAFVAPNEEGSQKFLKEMKSLKEDYQFSVNFIPDNRTSQEDMIRIHCAKDGLSVIDSAIDGSGYEDLEVDKNCKIENLQNKMLAYSFTGSQAIPLVISPSSLIAEGNRPDGWTKFLKENKR